MSEISNTQDVNAQNAALAEKYQPLVDLGMMDEVPTWEAAAEGDEEWIGDAPAVEED